METILLKTNLHCDHCISVVEPILKSQDSIEEFEFDLDHPDKLIKLKSEKINTDHLIDLIGKSGYKAELMMNQIGASKSTNNKAKNLFWTNNYNWKRASFNTLNCLIGCSIGDFGMIIFLQAYYPGTSIMWQMILAIIAGLMTSITLETIILKTREKFNLSLAFKTALSMSFISMIGMEFAMNATDFMITGGKAAFNTASYWLALAPSMIIGFMLPLPYNYYKLEKHGMACH